MSQTTTPITISSSTPTTNTNVVVTAGPAVTNTYINGGMTETFTGLITFSNQFATLDNTNTGDGDQAAGIDLAIGDVSGGQSSVGQTAGTGPNQAGLISGYQYGIFLSAANGVASNSVKIFNDIGGTITSRAVSYNTNNNPNTSGIFSATGTSTTISNSGLVQGGRGIFLESNDAALQSIVNDVSGTIAGTLGLGSGTFGIDIRDNDNGLQGTGSVLNNGLIIGTVEMEAKYGFITNSSTGTITQGVGVFGTGTLALDAGGSFGGGAGFGDLNGLPLATLLLGPGSSGQIGTLSSPGLFEGFGSVTVQSGADWTLGSAGATTGFATVSTISDFGTIYDAGLLSGNTIDMEGSVTGTATKVEFTGANTSTPIDDFRANDQIVLDNLAGGTSFKDSYNSTTDVLTVSEYNTAGQSIGSDTITVSGVTGLNLSTGSFIDISGTGGPRS